MRKENIKGKVRKYILDEAKEKRRHQVRENKKEKKEVKVRSGRMMDD